MQGKQGPDRDIEWPIHGDIRIYTSEKEVWIEYVVRFTHGCVEWIKPVEEVPPLPEVPPLEVDWESLSALSEILKSKRKHDSLLPSVAADSGAGDETGPDPEEALLANLRRDQNELEALLKSCSDHWGYEDPLYRFYHQSFKVYALQQTTETIIQRLQALIPERPLHSWFLQIVQAGTGKQFQSEDNARWTEVTRPILEAFFHARFFLEMAVRYADLQAPPQPLPSGYAALLYLFGLR